jgi:hypothetical protein
VIERTVYCGPAVEIADMAHGNAEPMIRWWIFNAETNGFDVCMFRVRGRILIDGLAVERA